ncbi:MAG: YihA family ribosome biogenesis GTP-binding protein [Flavobacteriales bacterium]|nr:YihA family ribosome biogenesis GTP-binding protein [Flavobacteriales bacterium]
MKIRSAKFVMSNKDISKCPEPNLPEYAFIGRSNVGKSSLINMLFDRKSLAKISGTPGKTRLVNHFLINEEWYLVDLPGYGYAKISKKDRASWKIMINTYLKNRPNLMSVFVLIDSRLEAQKIDLEFMEWLGKNGIPFAIIFTKIDKLNSGVLNKNKKAYQKEMLKTWEFLPPMFESSAQKSYGKEHILKYIEEVNHMY